MVDNITSQRTVPLDLYNQATTGAGEIKNKVGAGLAGKTGAAPDVTSQGGAGNVAASLSAFMSKSSSVDTEVLLVQVAVTMRDTEANTQKSKINTDQEAKKAELKEKGAKLEEAAKKAQEAEDKRKSGNIFDKIKLAFEWLGAILATVVAGVLIATGVGAAVGVALAAAAVTAIIMAIDSTVQMATGMGIAGNLVMLTAEARGLTPEQAKEEAGKADMGFKIALAVAGIGLAIAGGVASSVNSIRAAASAIKDGVKAAIDAYRAVDTGVQIASQSARMTLTGLNIADNVTKVASVGVEAASMTVNYQATEARADAKVLEAAAKGHEAKLQMIDDMIDQAIGRLMAAGDRFNNILDQITDAVQDRGDSLSRARFTG